MAKITWLGEDIENGPAGPSHTIAHGGLKFEKGKSVNVTDKTLIAKAQANQFFEVELTPEEQKSAEERAEAVKVTEKLKEPEVAPMDQKRGPGRPPKPKADEA